jgi:hypothetical protein
LKKHSLFTILVFVLGLSFGTFAQSKDELKLKSFYNEGKFDKCDQLCAKLEKKSVGNDLALVHLYGALSNLGMLQDENFDVYNKKKPIKVVAVEFGKFLKVASDSLKEKNSEVVAKIYRELQEVIVNQLELKKYNEAKYLADKLTVNDTLNVGADLVLDFVSMTEGGAISNNLDVYIESGYALNPRYKMFFVDVVVLYAAWLTKEGKSDSAAELANKAITLAGENELLEVFR